MRETKPKLKLSWIPGLICLGISGWLIQTRPPDSWMIEAGVVLLTGLGGWLGLSAIVSKKTAGLMTFGLIALLVLNRLGAVEPLTVLLLAAVLAGLGVI